MNVINNGVVAAIQMVSTDSVEENLKTVETLVSNAVSKGAKLVVLPENFALMPPQSSDQLIEAVEPLGAGAIQSFISSLAKNFSCWIIAGSIPTKSEVANKVYATCIVYNDEGVKVAHYHKTHLFDVDVPDDKKCYRESDTFVAGDEAVVVQTPVGKVGLSICYDLRFPELYRKLLAKGAELIVAPSAFTDATGRAHWSLLCRARAVENSCYLIAANQGGRHKNKRETFGHSMIVDPWGAVLVELEKGEGIAITSLQKDQLNKVRASFPAIKHIRL